MTAGIIPRGPSDAGAAQARAAQRMEIDVPASLSLSGNKAIPGRVTNISWMGAGFALETPLNSAPMIEEPAKIDIDGIGELGARVVRVTAQTIGVKFDLAAGDKEKIAAQIDRINSAAD